MASAGSLTCWPKASARLADAICSDTTVTAVETAGTRSPRVRHRGRAHHLRQHRLDRAAHHTRTRSWASRDVDLEYSVDDLLQRRNRQSRRSSITSGRTSAATKSSRGSPRRRRSCTSTTPPGKSGLCVEFTCREGDERWRNPERYIAAIVADLVRTRRHGIGRRTWSGCTSSACRSPIRSTS